MKKYNVLSPDGFPINYENTYNSPKEALIATLERKKNYQQQGYYSSVKYGRIHLDDLEDFCELIEVE